MATTAGAGPSGSSAGPANRSAKSAVDPILRNALRYTISAREYALLHRYIISRSRLLKKRAPTVDSVQRIMNGKPHNRGKELESPSRRDKGKAKEGSSGASAGAGSDEGTAHGEARDMALGGADDYNARAIRHSIRVFLATGALMKLWGLVSGRLMKNKQG